MIKIIATIILSLFATIALTQSIEKFKVDFKNSIEEGFSDEELDQMFDKYSAFLTPHSDVTQLANYMIEGKSIMYPLFDFKETELYKNNINILFQSHGTNDRIVSYLLIASSNDKSFEIELLTRIKGEKSNSEMFWAGMALLHTKSTETTQLFDFIAKNENFADAHMIPLFFNLEADSLIATAFNRIESEEVKSKILAAQILSKAKPTQRVENTLKTAVQEWEIGIKGYAIYSLSALKIGNLLPTLEPFLDSSQTRSIALEALANSDSDGDKKYFIQLFDEQNFIEKDILNCLFKSKQTDNVRLWLKILRQKETPENYYFQAKKQSLLSTDDLLLDVQLTLEQKVGVSITKNLIRTLIGRIDDRSVSIFINLLKDDNHSIRYWAADALKGTSSEIIIHLIPELLNSEEFRTVALTDIAIENNQDTLHYIFDDYIAKYKSGDWRNSSMKYVSAFPKSRHIEVFRNVLDDDNMGYLQGRYAAIGLGNLRDKKSIDYIEKGMNRERKNSDSNVQTYLKALDKINDPIAVEIISKFIDSDVQVIRELVDELLSNGKE